MATTYHLTHDISSLSSIWVFVFLLFAAPAQAAELAAARPSSTTEDPKQLVEELAQTVLLALDRDRNEIRGNSLRIYEIVDEIISPHIDIHRVSRLVLGKHWAGASPMQRRRFQTAMADRIVQTLVNGISQFVAAAGPKSTKIRYLASRPGRNPRDVTVRSRFGGAGAPSIRVDYRLYQVDGRWRIYDVVIAGASLILAYRRDYVVEVERSGLDRLIDLLSVDTPGAYRGHRSVGKSPVAGS